MTKTFLIALCMLAALPASGIETEQLPGEGVWVSPPPHGQQLDRERPFRATVWFEPQFLGDGKGFERRAKEFANTGRQTDPHEFENLIGKAKTDESLQAVIKKLSAWIPKEEAGEPDLVDDRVKP